MLRFLIKLPLKIIAVPIWMLLAIINILLGFLVGLSATFCYLIAGISVRGFDPIMDNKFIPFNHPMFNKTADGKGEPYVRQIRGADNLIGPPFEILSDMAVKHYEKMKDKGENVYIDSLTYEQFMMLGDAELSRRFSMQDEAEQKAKIDREQANELEYVDESQKADDSGGNNTGDKPVRNPEREKPEWEDTITNRMLHWPYTPEQKEEVKKLLLQVFQSQRF